MAGLLHVLAAVLFAIAAVLAFGLVGTATLATIAGLVAAGLFCLAIAGAAGTRLIP